MDTGPAQKESAQHTFLPVTYEFLTESTKSSIFQLPKYKKVPLLKRPYLPRNWRFAQLERDEIASL